MASPTTPAAGTVRESVRSRSAAAGWCVSVSTERSGCVRVGSGFIAPQDHELLAGGHPALEAARAVGLAEILPAPRTRRSRRAPRGRPLRPRRGVAHGHALHRLDRHDRLCQPAVQALRPEVRPEPRHQSEGAPRTHRRATRCPSRRCRSRRPSPRSPGRRGTAPGDSSTEAKSSHAELLALGRLDAPDLHHVTAHLHAHGPQQRLGQPARRHPGGGLASAGPLEHVPRRCGRTSAPRPGRRGRDAEGAPRPPRRSPARVHPLLPVGVVAVDDRSATGLPSVLP